MKNSKKWSYSIKSGLLIELFQKILENSYCITKKCFQAMIMKRAVVELFVHRNIHRNNNIP